MEPRYLLDTNIIVYIRRKRPEQALLRFRQLLPGEAAISVITHGELFYGAVKHVQQARALVELSELIDLIPVLSLPENAPETYGTIRADLESKGEIIGAHDLWIAAHALASGLILVTNNEKEFRRVRGLKIQNWII